MNEIFKAIYDRLSTQLVGVSIYDHIPQDTVGFPFVRMEPLKLSENDTDNEQAFDCTIQIHTWSQTRGSKECADLQLQIYNALHRYNFADTASYCILTVHREFSEILIDPDGITRHGVDRYRVMFEPIPTP